MSTRKSVLYMRWHFDFCRLCMGTEGLCVDGAGRYEFSRDFWGSCNQRLLQECPTTWRWHVQLAPNLYTSRRLWQIRWCMRLVGSRSQGHLWTAMKNEQVLKRRCEQGWQWFGTPTFFSQFEQEGFLHHVRWTGWLGQWAERLPALRMGRLQARAGVPQSTCGSSNEHCTL